MKKLIVLLFCILVVSCDYFNFKEKKDYSSEIIAIVNTEKLFREDLKGILPESISKQDSLILIKSYIQDWAIKKLLITKASNNNSIEDVNEIEKLVKDYKESLLINKYKEQLIKEQLDTFVKEEDIYGYYNLNKENFKLNEELVKVKYLHFDNNVLDKDEFIDLFKSNVIEDIETLEEKHLSFKFFRFNDSTWVPLDKVLLKLPFSKDVLLKKTKFIQKQDSLGLYLVAVKDLLPLNAIAPLSHIKPTIKQIILHKRKIELISEIEKTLVTDAIQNNNFKIY